MNTLPAGYSEEQVVQEIRNSVEQSKLFMDPYRNEILNNYKDYNKKQDSKKILDRSIRTYVRIAQSLHTKYQPEVYFGVAWYDAEYETKAINELSKKSFKETQRARKNKLKVESMCISWVSIELQKWNDIEDNNDYILINTLSWLPSPQRDPNYWFDYHHFELYMTAQEIAYGGFINLDSVKSKKEIKKEKYIRDNFWQWNLNWSQIKQLKDYVNTINNSENNIYEIIVSLYRFGWVPYWVFTHKGWDVSSLLWCYEIKWVTKKHKRNPSTIEYPVTITWLRENALRVVWDNFYTLSAEEQSFRQMYTNWMNEKARQSAWYGIMAIDSTKVRNPEVLFEPNPDWITVVDIDYDEWWQMPQWVQQDAIDNDVYNMRNILEQEMWYKLWYDRSDTWVVEWNATLGEQIKAQKNRNALTLFNETYFIDGEAHFWSRWLEQLARYGKKKFNYISSVDWLYTQAWLNVWQLNKIVDRIIVKHISEIEEEKRKDKEFFTIFWPQLLEFAQREPSFTEYSILKDQMIAWGMDEYKIEKYLNEPMELYTWQIAYRMILEWKSPKVEIDEDHKALLTMIRPLPMSKEKIKYTTKLLDAITNKISKAKQMQAPWQAPWQAQANIAMNAKVQEQQANQEPSLQDVTQL